MKHGKWHIREEGETVTLSLDANPIFDFAAETRLPFAAPQRLAHQIRQDMWRALQSLRGFKPVIEVTRVTGGMDVRAGGTALAPYPKASAIARAQAVLDDPQNRKRWVKYARGMLR